MIMYKQLTLYYVFLHNGHSRTGLDRDELQLHKANQSNDPLQMAIAISKLTLNSSYIKDTALGW